MMLHFCRKQNLKDGGWETSKAKHKSQKRFKANTEPPTDSIKNGRRTKGLDPKTKGEVGGTEQGETKCIETGQNKNTHADV